MTDIAFALWLLRTAQGLTQEDLAQRISASRQQVSDWENGAKLPTLEKFSRLCRGLDVSPHALLAIAAARDARVTLKRPPQSVGLVERRRAA